MCIIRNGSVAHFHHRIAAHTSRRSQKVRSRGRFTGETRENRKREYRLNRTTAASREPTWLKNYARIHYGLMGHTGGGGRAEEKEVNGGGEGESSFEKPDPTNDPHGAPIPGNTGAGLPPVARGTGPRTNTPDPSRLNGWSAFYMKHGGKSIGTETGSVYRHVRR